MKILILVMTVALVGCGIEEDRFETNSLLARNHDLETVNRKLRKSLEEMTLEKYNDRERCVELDTKDSNLYAKYCKRVVEKLKEKNEKLSKESWEMCPKVNDVKAAVESFRLYNQYRGKYYGI